MSEAHAGGGGKREFDATCCETSTSVDDGGPIKKQRIYDELTEQRLARVVAYEAAMRELLSFSEDLELHERLTSNEDTIAELEDFRSAAACWQSETPEVPETLLPLISKLVQSRREPLSKLQQQVYERLFAKETPRTLTIHAVRTAICTVAMRKAYGKKAVRADGNEDVDEDARWRWEASFDEHLPKWLREEVKSMRRRNGMICKCVSFYCAFLKLASSSEIDPAKLAAADDKIIRANAEYKKLESTLMSRQGALAAKKDKEEQQLAKLAQQNRAKKEKKAEKERKLAEESAKEAKRKKDLEKQQGSLKSFLKKGSAQMPKFVATKIQPNARFQPFIITPHTILAPALPRISSEPVDVMERLRSPPPKSINELLAEVVSRYHSSRLRRRNKTRTRGRVGIFLFHTDYRPAFYAKAPGRSQIVNGKRPFARDSRLIDYEVDSDDEWGDEPDGENLSESDEDDNDDEEAGKLRRDGLVEDGWLMDEECDEAARELLLQQQSFAKNQQPVVVGPVFASDIVAACDDLDLETVHALAPYRVHVFSDVVASLRRRWSMRADAVEEANSTVPISASSKTTPKSHFQKPSMMMRFLSNQKNGTPPQSTAEKSPRRIILSSPSNPVD